MQKKSLVTGGAGFIGSHVARHLLDLNHEVVVLDDLSGGFEENIPAGAIFYQGSILDVTLVNSLFEKHSFDYVYHLAAYAAEGLSHFIRRFNYENNLIGSMNLINASVNYGIKCFVFTSSIAVYGTNELPYSENQHPHPEDPYGVAKYAVEMDLKCAHSLFGLNYIIFRPHNVYGSHQHIADKYRNVIGIFMHQVLTNQPLQIFGDGEQTRAFTHISDVAPAIACSVEKPTAYNEVFNIGVDEPTTVNQLAELVLKTMSVSGEVEHLEARQEVAHAVASHEKFRQVFNPKTSLSLEEGLLEMATWVKSVANRKRTNFEGIEIEKKSTEHMENSPLVSIVMAVKDTAPYLRECLDSILAQTYSNWELIAVNDHSSDETPAILAEYAEKDQRIRTYNSDRPKLIPTLQVAYAQVKGSLINRMDSDDRMPAYKLQVLVDEWQKVGKGHVIAGGTEHFVDEGEVGDGFLKYERWLNEVARKGSHYQEIYKECVIPSHCWLMHKEDFDAIDAFNPIIYPEDYDLCFRMYKKKLTIVGIDVVLHHWRDRSNRISRTWDEYKDNRYYDMKLRFFYELDRDFSRDLVIWGAGKNGKDLAKLILERKDQFKWVCDNDNKIGKDIYGVILAHFSAVSTFNSPQILIVVSSPDGKKEIEQQLIAWGKLPVKDYWFFG